MSESFGRLQPAVRYMVKEILRFPSLRPVQEQTIAPVLDGRDVVVLAPTAGGKTEAALLPVFSRILAEDLPPVSVLYVCPLRALLNNLEPRLARMAGALGLTVGKWHGDVPASERRKLVEQRPDLLLITPESLEVLLMGASQERKALVGRVRMAVVDEVHAFAADARGAHLVSVLHRLELRGGGHIQRVGLSATVGNPESLARWLQGTDADEEPRVVDPQGERAKPEFHFLATGSGSRRAAQAIRDLGRGQKRLVFVESRSRAEELGDALQGIGVRTWVHHSSVGRARREEAEEAFESVRDAALVATSSMELGIDIGDLDHVFQLDAPATVSSLAQRLGRTGRRPGAIPRMTFLAESPEKLLLAMALTELFESGWIEDIQPSTRLWTVLVHQIFANLLERGGCTRGQLVDRLRPVPSFSGFEDREIADLLSHLLDEGWLDEADGALLLGQRAEKTFGARNFFKLYAVFDTPPAFTVYSGPEEIGTLQAWFATQLTGRRKTFQLGGKAWEATDIDMRRGTIRARPAKAGIVPSWSGQPTPYSREVCERILDLIIGGRVPEGTDRDAALWLGHARDQFEGVPLAPTQRPLVAGDDRTTWHTFAGARINAVLARLLEHVFGIECSFSNTVVKIAAPGTEAAEAAMTVSDSLAESEPPRDGSWATFDSTSRRHILSAFQECLPDGAEQEFLRRAFLDIVGAHGWASSCG